MYFRFYSLIIVIGFFFANCGTQIPEPLKDQEQTAWEIESINHINGVWYYEGEFWGYFTGEYSNLSAQITFDDTSGSYTWIGQGIRTITDQKSIETVDTVEFNHTGPYVESDSFLVLVDNPIAQDTFFKMESTNAQLKVNAKHYESFNKDELWSTVILNLKKQ